MTSRQVNLVMWTIVISIVVICAGHKYFGPTSVPSWVADLGPVAMGVVVIGVILLAVRSGARSAKRKEKSAAKYFVFLLIGIGCDELAKEFPILGLGALLGLYGLAGLAVIGFRKLSQRGKSKPTAPDQGSPR